MIVMPENYAKCQMCSLLNWSEQHFTNKVAQAGNYGNNIQIGAVRTHAIFFRPY